MQHPIHILIAEDELKVAALLRDYLKADGMAVETVARGDEVLPALNLQHYDILLLDLRMPGQGGLDVLRELHGGGLRNTDGHVPGVIVISALVEEVDRLLGLEMGADDYICKPFSPREVVARVKALLRRLNKIEAPVNGQSGASATLQVELDEARMQVRVGANACDLTAVEFRLLQTLRSQPGRVFGRSQIMPRLYQDHRIVSERTVDSHVKKLRRKLEQVAPDWDMIDSVYGVGFRFEPKPRSEPREPEATQVDD